MKKKNKNRNSLELLAEIELNGLLWPHITSRIHTHIHTHTCTPKMINQMRLNQYIYVQFKMGPLYCANAFVLSTARPPALLPFLCLSFDWIGLDWIRLDWFNVYTYSFFSSHHRICGWRSQFGNFERNLYEILKYIHEL